MTFRFKSVSERCAKSCVKRHGRSKLRLGKVTNVCLSTELEVQEGRVCRVEMENRSVRVRASR